MARTKATLGRETRLADYLCASMLAHVITSERVNDALEAHGRNI